MKTLVYTWEMGGGFGHVGPFSSVAKRFLADGWKVVLIVKDLSRVPPFFKPGDVDVLQAPIKNSFPVPHLAEPATYGHMLLNMGYQNADELAAHVEAWRHLFAFLRPEVIVFDHSPTAMLAARGLPARQATIGTGFCCPPATEPLPLLAEWRPMDLRQRRSDEAELTARINTVLNLWNIPPLDCLASLFRAIDDHLLTTWPELDHYGVRPETHYYGTWSIKPFTNDDAAVEQWQHGGGRKIFAYLKAMKGLPQLVATLNAIEADALMVIDNADVAPLRTLAGPNVSIVNRPVAMQRVLERCDIAILNGNHGSVAEFLLRGIPLLLLPLNLEQAILGKRVEAIQAAALALPDDLDGVSHQLQALLRHPERLAGARAFQNKYGGRPDADRIEQVFARLVSLSPRAVL